MHKKTLTGKQITTNSYFTSLEMDKNGENFVEVITFPSLADTQVAFFFVSTFTFFNAIFSLVFEDFSPFFGADFTFFIHYLHLYLFKHL